MRFGLTLTHETDYITAPDIMPDHLINRACTIKRRTATASVDDYGNAAKTTTTQSTYCSLQQVRREEPGDQGELSVTQWNIYFPTGTLVDTGDAVVVESAEYEVVGAPWDAQEGSPGLWHVEATVKRSASEDD